MNSIDKQQQEDNLANLVGGDAVEKIRELANKAKTCFFCTHATTQTPFSTRPMAVQKIDDSGVFWFLSSNDSHKNAEILQDPSVQLFFQGSAHSDFMTLYGHATISQDKAKIKELWEPLMKTWFTEGEDDPRISVIRFVPEDGHYWDTKHGAFVAFAKQVTGAVLGKTLDDSIQGSLKV
ncbi:pyridoxamine 5'-phosphate oxidase family protein [Pollutibacter soli]|uniref:pyridoxamine 5'-phosphate oxidase family protein n=1 Tax=Pollutibacter soli TaxID=3034157 RepID=UPI003013BECC